MTCVVHTYNLCVSRNEDKYDDIMHNVPQVTSHQCFSLIISIKLQSGNTCNAHQFNYTNCKQAVIDHLKLKEIDLNIFLKVL